MQFALDPKLIQRFIFCAVLAVTGASADAQQSTWKWRDKTGRVSFSDLPPPSDVSEKDILQRPSPTRTYALPAPAASAASASAAASAPRVDPELVARRQRAEQEKLEKRKLDDTAAAIARAANCKRAQDYMRTLDDGMRIARVNESGQREFLDDQQRAVEVQRTKQTIASDCTD